MSYCYSITDCNDSHSALRVDTAFHPLCSQSAAKRISNRFKMSSVMKECIHNALTSNTGAESWMVIVQNDNDELPTIVIRNLALTNQPINNRKVCKIVVKVKNEMIEFASYIFDVLIASLLLLHTLQFIAHLSFCTYRQ
jgi:hypothetical protein